MNKFVHIPAKPLSKFVEYMWFQSGYQPSGQVEHVLPGGGAQIIINPDAVPFRHFSSDFKTKGYSTITPYLAIQNADRLVRFLKKVFNAEEHRLMRGEDGSFMHGEFRIGDSLLMIGDVQDRHDPFPGMLYVYIPDVDETYKKALEEGATSVEEPVNQDYGDRRAAFSAPSGNRWYIASHIYGPQYQ